MVKHTLTAAQVTELRARQTMIEYEQDRLTALNKILTHEREITHQLEGMVLLLTNQHLEDIYRDDYAARLRLLAQQRKYLNKLRKKTEFTRLRIEAMAEAMSFYLVEHLSINPSLPWTLDIDNECVFSNGELAQAL